MNRIPPIVQENGLILAIDQDGKSHLFSPGDLAGIARGRVLGDEEVYSWVTLFDGRSLFLPCLPFEVCLAITAAVGKAV